MCVHLCGLPPSESVDGVLTLCVCTPLWPPSLRVGGRGTDAVCVHLCGLPPSESVDGVLTLCVYTSVASLPQSQWTGY